MLSKQIGSALAGATFVAIALAGCTMDGIGIATGTIVFCVQDEPTTEFNGVIVNFGNIQINTGTSGNNTINDNDTFNDGGQTTAATDDTDATDPNMTGNETTSASANETTQATSPATQETMATSEPSGAPAETIQVSDVECSRVEGRGDFDFNVPGQRNIETGDGENPGQGDEARGRSDLPCDRDQGFGNDWKCENGTASKEIEVESADVDLVEFQQGRAAFLARAEVPPMVIEDACVTLDDVRVTTNESGEEREVEIQVDRVCVQGPIEIREGHETLAVLKVDLEQSLREEGDRLVFAPVVHLRAAAPVLQTITVHETVTQTTTQTMDGTDSTNETAGTTSTSATTETFGTNETASPSPTQTSPTNTTEP